MGQESQGKNLKISELTHLRLKLYCVQNKLSLYQEADKMILEALENKDGKEKALLHLQDNRLKNE